MAIFLSFAVFVAVSLLIYAWLENAEERSSIRASLRALDDYDPTDLREQELQAPIAQRVLRPVARSVVAVGRRLVPIGYMENVRRKLVVAGRSTPEDLDRFRAMRVLTVAAVPVVAILVAALPMNARLRVTIFVLLAAACLVAPDAILNRQMEERRHAMRLRLPDVIDLLTISVDAGLGFDQALARTVAAVPGPLSEEFGRMLGELRAGAGRVDVLRNMESRTDLPELRSFLLALIQAETFGVSIGRILRAQAEELRVKRRHLAQEAAQKAPVKLLFPMVLCVFPGIFVVLIGPAMLNYLTSQF